MPEMMVTHSLIHIARAYSEATNHFGTKSYFMNLGSYKEFAVVSNPTVSVLINVNALINLMRHQV